jgi:transposase
MATDKAAPQVRQGVEPFHVIKLADEATDKTRRWAWNTHREALQLLVIGSA